MTELTATLSRVPARGRSGLWVVLPIVVILASIGGFFAYQTWQASQAPRASARTATAQQIEDQWGIRITQVGMTADNGMVDFRYRVIDRDKALNMLQDLNTVPVLIAEDNNTLVNSAAMMTKLHDLNAGQVYFILFHNNKGAVKTGRPVSVVIGNLRFEHVIVQ